MSKEKAKDATDGLSSFLEQEEQRLRDHQQSKATYTTSSSSVVPRSPRLGAAHITPPAPAARNNPPPRNPVAKHHAVLETVAVHPIAKLRDYNFVSADVPNRAVDELGIYSHVVRDEDAILVDIVLSDQTVLGKSDENRKTDEPKSMGYREVSKEQVAAVAAEEQVPSVLKFSARKETGGYEPITGTSAAPPPGEAPRTNGEREETKPSKIYNALLRAGPRAKLHFDPSEVTAAIVTCGGLCPGLNAVIHHLVNTLWHIYGVRRIMGVRGGYHGMSRFADSFDFGTELFGAAPAREKNSTGGGGGSSLGSPGTLPLSSSPGSAVLPLTPRDRNDLVFHSVGGPQLLSQATKDLSGTPTMRGRGGGGADTRSLTGDASNEYFEPISLSAKSCQGIPHMGGTVLGSSRGGFDLGKISAFLSLNKVNALFVIGGDGTHRGADKISKHVADLGTPLSVVGIPKTIDNDIGLIDRSFGFLTAVEEARKAIISAKVEAASNMPNGIGVVKLMGRNSGFIAVHATLSMGGDVDLCLIPEVPLILRGQDAESGCLPHLARVLKSRGHAVVVVAEGAGEEAIKRWSEPICSSKNRFPAGASKPPPEAVDKSGNKKLPKIGEFLTAHIKRYFEQPAEWEAEYMRRFGKDSVRADESRRGNPGGPFRGGGGMAHSGDRFEGGALSNLSPSGSTDPSRGMIQSGMRGNSTGHSASSREHDVTISFDQSEHFPVAKTTPAVVQPPKEVTIKYIDPSYMIRSVGPNAVDSRNDPLGRAERSGQ